VHDCIARNLQAFDAPALPACPNVKCVCSWFWVRNSTGGSDPMFMTAFQCNVTNPSKRVIGQPSAPVRCDGKPPCYTHPDWGNSTSKCRNVLNPLYWANNEGCNIFNPTNIQCAPTYADAYGYPDGAQHQIFVDNMDPLPGSIGNQLSSNSDTNAIFSLPSLASNSIKMSLPPPILVSPKYASSLSVQPDGNVVLADVATGKLLWSTGTSGIKGVAPYRLTMQNDGNLVLSDSSSKIFWSTNTANVPASCGPFKLKLRDANQLTIVDSNGTPLWTAKTV